MNDYQAAIAACCKQLRLSSSLAERSLTQLGENHQEYLYNLLTDEVSHRRRQRITKLINTAGFPRQHSFEQFRDEEVQFPSDDALIKMLYLATEKITKRWTRRYPDWDIVINQLAIMYGERMEEYIS